MLDRDAWLLHRDQMEVLHRIEKLLTEAVHERRATRKEIKALTDLLQQFEKSAPRASFDWRALLDSVLMKVGMALFLGGTGLVAWTEAVKIAIK